MSLGHPVRVGAHGSQVIDQWSFILAQVGVTVSPVFP